MQNEVGKTGELIKKIEQFEDKIQKYLNEKFNITHTDDTVIDVDSLNESYIIRQYPRVIYSDEVWTFIKEILKDFKIPFEEVDE